MNALLALAVYALTASKTMAADYVLGASDVRALRQFSLENRYPDKWVSGIFRDNILLSLAYMEGRVTGKPDWKSVSSPQTYDFTLKPGDVFAFHKGVLPQYAGKVTKTMNADFAWNQGFKSDGLLVGDGVCQLASMMYWQALAAGLTAYAPTNHDFAAIPEVPKEYGVSILYGDVHQNLYITNSFTKPVTFTFVNDGKNLAIKITD